MTEDIIRPGLQLNSVKITDYTFRKLNMYARIVADLSGAPREVMGLITGSPGDGGIGTDAVLIKKQEITGSSVRAPAGMIEEAYARAIDEGYLIVGMWHSHGVWSNFHSDTDQRQLATLLTYNSYAHPVYLEADTNRIPYAASIVVNRTGFMRDDPCSKPEQGEHFYCCAAIRENEVARIVPDMRLELIESGKKAADMDSLVNDICSNVRYRGNFLRKKSICEYVQLEFDFMSEENHGPGLFSLLKRLVA